jgi:hypothetical protein
VRFSSREGSTDLQRSTRSGQRGSRRQPGGGLTGKRTSPLRVPLPGAIETYTKTAMQVKDNLQPLLQEVFGSQ